MIKEGNCVKDQDPYCAQESQSVLNRKNKEMFTKDLIFGIL